MKFTELTHNVKTIKMANIYNLKTLTDLQSSFCEVKLQFGMYPTLLKVDDLLPEGRPGPLTCCLLHLQSVVQEY